MTQATFFSYGGISGSATSAQVDLALAIAWDWVEEELDTNLVISLESNEIHLWPREARDWDERHDRVYTSKHHISSIAYVQMLEESDACNCTLTVLSGCALVIDAEAGMVAVRQCSSAASAVCTGCGSLRPLQARISYYAGLFATSALNQELNLAIVMKANEVLAQITAGAVAAMGSMNITQWRSMDYSETRAGPKGASFIDDYVQRLIRKYKPHRAFSLRRTY